MSKKLSQLTTANTVSNSDMIPIVQNQNSTNVNKKTTISEISKIITSDTVKYTEQLNKTSLEKTIARSNIGAASDTKVLEVESIAKGAQSAVSYVSYVAMINVLNALENTALNVGQNIYIQTLNVPDLWVYSIESSKDTYTYIDDSEVIDTLNADEYIQVGYYKLSMLETLKIDLTNYITKTDYATVETGGIVRVDVTKGITIDNGTIEIARAAPIDLQRKDTPYNPITPTILDIAVKESTHQNMSEEYDIDTIITNETYREFYSKGCLPASYNAVKDYVDGEILKISSSVIFPEEYGAEGDGIFDDTTAFRKALYKCTETGKVLYISSGKSYKITGPLNYCIEITSEKYGQYYDCAINIKGYTPTRSVIYNLNGGTNYKGEYGRIILSNSCLFFSSAIKGSIENVTITASGLNVSLFKSCSLGSFTLKGCYLQDFYSIFLDSGLAMCAIDSNKFMHTSVFAKYGEVGTTAQDSTIINNYINGTAGVNSSCFEWAGFDGTTIQNNFIDFFRTIYCPKSNNSIAFYGPVSIGNEYQVFRYFYWVSNENIYYGEQQQQQPYYRCNIGSAKISSLNDIFEHNSTRQGPASNRTQAYSRYCKKYVSGTWQLWEITLGEILSEYFHMTPEHIYDLIENPSLTPIYLTKTLGQILSDYFNMTPREIDNIMENLIENPDSRYYNIAPNNIKNLMEYLIEEKIKYDDNIKVFEPYIFSCLKSYDKISIENAIIQGYIEPDQLAFINSTTTDHYSGRCVFSCDILPFHPFQSVGTPSITFIKGGINNYSSIYSISLPDSTAAPYNEMDINIIANVNFLPDLSDGKTNTFAGMKVRYKGEVYKATFLPKSTNPIMYDYKWVKMSTSNFGKQDNIPENVFELDEKVYTNLPLQRINGQYVFREGEGGDYFMYSDGVEVFIKPIGVIIDIITGVHYRQIVENGEINLEEVV